MTEPAPSETLESDGDGRDDARHIKRIGNGRMDHEDGAAARRVDAGRGILEHDARWRHRLRDGGRCGKQGVAAGDIEGCAGAERRDECEHGQRHRLARACRPAFGRAKEAQSAIGRRVGGPARFPRGRRRRPDRFELHVNNVVAGGNHRATATSIGSI
ncbi:MAG: hypothetical protein ACN6I5_05620 [Hyphomicrobiales bacterium]